MKEINKHLEEIIKRVNDFPSNQFRKFPGWMIPKDRVEKIIREYKKELEATDEEE